MNETVRPSRHGIRRGQADAVDALRDVSASVKNRMGGWTKTSTREGYLEGHRREDAEAAAAVRRKVRPGNRLSAPGESEEER